MIDRRVDSRFSMNTWPQTAWPASWIAVARSSCFGYGCPIATPASMVVIASTRSRRLKTSRLSACAYVSASEQTWSIMAGE